MYLYDFPPKQIDTFQPGTSPRVCRISHSGGNPTWQYALHVHPDQVELHYVVGGQTSITLDKQVYTVTAGDIVLISQGIPHAIASHPEHPSETWCLRADGVQFNSALGQPLMAAHTNAGEHGPFIQQTMAQLYALTGRLDTAVQAACNHLGTALIALYRHLLLESTDIYTPRSRTLAGDVLAYINEHYNEEITLAHLADRFFLSASHISREFRREFSVSPINFLINKRLSEARWLLINTAEPLHAVSQQVGYQNVYHFTKLFTKRVGLSPTAYRETYGNRERLAP